jgi:hypothetical protein
MEGLAQSRGWSIFYCPGGTASIQIELYFRPNQRAIVV